MTRPDDAPPPPKPLTPARPAESPGPPKPPTPVGREGGDRVEADVPRPTPVRAAMDTSPVPDVPAEECTLDVEGTTWRVRVLGRSQAGVGTVGTPLLLLGFTSADQNGPDREALVVGSALEDLPEAALLVAHRAARPPRSEAERSRPLFAGAAGDRRKRH